MTRYLTCQVLNRRSQGINYKMPNLKAFMRPERADQEQGKGEEISLVRFILTCFNLLLLHAEIITDGFNVYI